MGGQILLNYEVTGFSEMSESKGEVELAPISVLSKNRVRSFSVDHLNAHFTVISSYNFFIFVLYCSV